MATVTRGLEVVVFAMAVALSDGCAPATLRGTVNNPVAVPVGSLEFQTMVLDDHLSTTFPDPAHSRLERRFLSIGASSRQRLLVICHSEEGAVVRIISARRATRHERRFYEEGS